MSIVEKVIGRLHSITFSDIKNYYDREQGKAMKDCCDFFNSHPEYEIITIIERQQIIENGGNGTCYYDLDVIYDDKGEQR